MTVAAVCLAAVPSLVGRPSQLADQGRGAERQSICLGHEGGRSWNHYLETTCLADLTLRGIVKTTKGYKALLESDVTGVTFTAELGALIYDGVVVAIDGEAVTIRQTIGVNSRFWQASGSDEKLTRLVRRRLAPESKTVK